MSNEDGNANNECSKKSHFWFALNFFVRGIRALFLCLSFVNGKMIKCLSMKLNKYRERFSYCVLVVSTTLKKVFSRCNYSDSHVQVPSLMHSNLQLLYLLCSLPSRARARSSSARPLLSSISLSPIPCTLNTTQTKMTKRYISHQAVRSLTFLTVYGR